MHKFVHRFLRAESGATAIEYALIASLIAAAIATTLGLLGQNLTGLFQKVVNAFPA